MMHFLSKTILLRFGFKNIDILHQNRLFLFNSKLNFIMSTHTLHCVRESSSLIAFLIDLSNLFDLTFLKLCSLVHCVIDAELLTAILVCNCMTCVIQSLNRVT